MDEHEYFDDMLGESADKVFKDVLGNAFYQETKRRTGPQYYHRDGKPIVSTELMPDFLQWALLFENENRRVAETITHYGERLSTVFLGMDHSFCFEPDHTPILFETMLFAPRTAEDRQEMRERLSQASADLIDKGWKGMEWEVTDKEKQIEKYFPHDSLQLRYATEREAMDRHEELKMQCLIPPRWRRFLLYTIGGDPTWE
jgi:hypothetical protein